MKEKISETYIVSLETSHSEDINPNVNLKCKVNCKNGKLEIEGLHKMFIFHKSKPKMVRTIARLLMECSEIGDLYSKGGEL